LLQTEFLTNKVKILDFSPSRNLQRVLKENSTISYTTTDFSGEFPADKHDDITHLDMPDKSYDLVVCYHILEHVNEDMQAMRELYRVLNAGGACIIQTPYKEGDIYEDPSVQTPEGRLTHFGQADHVRIYSAVGLKNRLSQSGFQVEIKEYTEPKGNKYGFKEKEIILVAGKV
jgi:SAM-dependent methyltransferase